MITMIKYVCDHCGVEKVRLAVFPLREWFTFPKELHLCSEKGACLDQFLEQIVAFTKHAPDAIITNRPKTVSLR